MGAASSRRRHYSMGEDRWYGIYVPRADRLYDEHLAELRKEGWQDDG